MAISRLDSLIFVVIRISLSEGFTSQSFVFCSLAVLLEVLCRGRLLRLTSRPGQIRPLLTAMYQYSVVMQELIDY